MTAYHGGKHILGKDIAKIVSGLFSPHTKGYVEPFCGMLGVFRHISPETCLGTPGLPDKSGNVQGMQFLAGDIHGSVIEMWKAFQGGWTPPLTVSSEEYESLRRDRFTTPDSPIKGYVGHEYSYGGLYFGSLRPQRVGDQGKKIAKIKQVATKLSDVVFTKGDYTQFSDLEGFIIYCDPPYFGTVSKYLEKFDSLKFYNWCEKMAEKNTVLVSSMDIPEAFARITKVIFERKLKGRTTERLYLVVGRAK